MILPQVTHPGLSRQPDDLIIYMVISNLWWTPSLLHEDACPDDKLLLVFIQRISGLLWDKNPTIFNKILQKWFSPLFNVSLDSSPCKSLPAHALLPYSVLFLYPEGRYPAKWYLFKIPQCTNLAQKLEQRASPWLLQLGGIFPPQSPRSIYISSLKLQKQNEIFLLGLLRTINAPGSAKQKCCTK